LRDRIVLFRRLAKPFHRLLIILWHALPGLVADTQVTLRLWVAGFGGLAHFFKILPRLAVHRSVVLQIAELKVIPIRLPAPSIEAWRAISSRDCVKDGIKVFSGSADEHGVARQAVSRQKELTGTTVRRP
jgi:hypothetical protein